jgi:hypothetical protein
MTALTKKVIRRSDTTIRDEGKSRRIVITLYPSGVIGLRPEKTRREELLTVDAAWAAAVRMRVSRERADKRSKRQSHKIAP